MIWRSATCFDRTVAVFLLFTLCAPLFAATLTGRVQLAQLDEAAAKKQGGHSGVVIWLETIEAQPSKLVRKHVQMLQKNKSFIPHILAIQTGTYVDFPNLDPIFHNAFSNFDGQLFDVGLYPPGSSRSIRFTKPGIVSVFCNIHPSMSAAIVVIDSDHFATSDQAGNYMIPDIPAGNYQVHFYYERATQETLQRLIRPVAVTDGDLEVETVPISEAGYRPVGHKNKYGREYQSRTENDKTYSVRLP